MSHSENTRIKEPVTMKTIAEEAGVTLTTVSRILNNKGGKYAENTKKKIFAIAARHKYRPNALVRGMQTGKTGTAGVMIPISNSFYSQIVEGIQNEFVKNDTIMLLSWNKIIPTPEEESMERRVIHQMVDRRVDGIILRPSSEDFEKSYFEEIWERNIPLILVDRRLPKIDTDFVGTDDRAGGQMAAEHLISLGHQRMLFVGAGSSTATSRLREEGFRNVLSESPNASCGPSITGSTESTREQILQRLREDAPPTAIFCYHDLMAREVAQIVQEAGLSIPEDISILGFGNLPATDPGIGLTSFDQHPLEIGAAVARRYLQRVNSREENEFRGEIIIPDLIVRESTAPLREAVGTS